MIYPDDFRETLSTVEHKRRRRALAATPAERIARFEALQATAWDALVSNPVALAVFHQRNRRNRRQSHVQTLVAALRGPSSTHESAPLD